jgi:mannose-6-phosphate isomerase-like protein (cupin superfamily)
MSECIHTTPSRQVKQGANFTAYESGTLPTWLNRSVEIPGLGTLEGKEFLHDTLGFTSCEISVNAMPVGQSMPIYHQHKENEEIYLFIHGRGQLQVDGEIFDVQEGTVARIAPNGSRAWRNIGDKPLIFIIIQAKAGSLRQYGLADTVVPAQTVHWPN